MVRYIGSSCKLCRRERIKLFLKGSKCYNKCTLDRGKRKNIPGEHISRTKISEYAKRLREKQKLKRIFGLSEKQFRRYFGLAARKKGSTEENLLQLLETRLDNVVYKLNFAQSRKTARQMVTHGHILVNGKKKNVIGYRVKIGDKIALCKKMRENILVKQALEQTVSIPSWLSLDKDNFVAEVIGTPKEITYPVDITRIVELYSR